MNKSFLTIGLLSLALVAVFILTCPREADFEQYIAKKYDIECSGTDFTCVKYEGGHNVKLTLVQTTVKGRVFFMNAEKTFETNDGRTITIKALGILNTFLQSSIKEQ
ncbi:hypothetical protein [Bacillus sp. 165]|uniref:hypothetical protein n=1 Tax=Bacillus sp. 165 TaxID=1529117 RepID=UPI001ADA7910|nr:hypothetical protein [Bacillus sp. 165]MBO9129548.1 hypothetical protein [Bacillus sp. 165]